MSPSKNDVDRVRDAMLAEGKPPYRFNAFERMLLNTPAEEIDEDAQFDTHGRRIDDSIGDAYEIGEGL